MNAPRRQPNWQRELLQAAIVQLEAQYQRTTSACLALQISRNYRLLLTHQEAPNIKQAWRQRSRYWWQLYCHQQQIKNVAVSTGFHFEITQELS